MYFASSVHCASPCSSTTRWPAISATQVSGRIVAPEAAAKPSAARKSRLPAIQNTATPASLTRRMAEVISWWNGSARSSSPAQYSNRSPSRYSEAAADSLAVEAGGLSQAVSLFKFGKRALPPQRSKEIFGAANASDAALPLRFDPATIRRLSTSGPRYTSYPTADRFSADFGYGNYLEAVAGLKMRGGGRGPLSLYVHVPFCDTVCYYCGCNKIVTKDRSKAATYLSYLKQEIGMQGKLFSGMNQLGQLHFGGGTPTYLSDRQMEELMAHLRKNFEFAPDEEGEYSIEIDPRTVSRERVHSLRQQGFNRVSLGVQDFDPDVQKAVNRIQPEAETLAVMQAARDAGFRSISIDLIYGLPKQTLDTMRQTMAKVIAASPDRISLYNYAHLPHLFKPQRRILDADLPPADVKPTAEAEHAGHEIARRKLGVLRFDHLADRAAYHGGVQRLRL
eukprot:gene25198-28488_t